MKKDRVILFWSNIPSDFGYTNYQDWENSELKFSPYHDLVFKSHERLNNDVELWTFQQVTNFPYKNITIKNANKYINTEFAFNCLNMGHSIAFVSDAIRLKRASEVLGIVLDMDTVCLKPFPKYNSWFSTMPSKKTGGFAPKWGKNRPPMIVHDGSWNGKELTAFPLKVSLNTKKQIDCLADKIIAKLAQKTKRTSNEWNSTLWTIKTIADQDTTAKVFEPIYMSPLPAWLGKGKCYSIESPTRLTGDTVLFGHRLPSIDEIFEKSYVVAHFFESVWNNADLLSAENWGKLPIDCLLSKECELILGSSYTNSVQVTKEYQTSFI